VFEENERESHVGEEASFLEFELGIMMAFVEEIAGTVVVVVACVGLVIVTKAEIVETVVIVVAFGKEIVESFGEEIVVEEIVVAIVVAIVVVIVIVIVIVNFDIFQLYWESWRV